MVWLGRLFVLSFAVTRWSGSVSSLVSICPRTCFLTRLLGRMQSQDGLARSVVCPLICCDKMVWLGQLACFHLSPHVFSNALAGQDAVTRWSGSVGCLSSHLLSQDGLARSARLFPFVSARVFNSACWAGGCHEMVWLGRLFVLSFVPICRHTCFLTRLLGWMLSQDVTRWSGSVGCLSSHLFPFVASLLVWMLSRDGLLLTHEMSGSVSSCLPTSLVSSRSWRFVPLSSARSTRVDTRPCALSLRLFPQFARSARSLPLARPPRAPSPSRAFCALRFPCVSSAHVSSRCCLPLSPVIFWLIRFNRAFCTKAPCCAAFHEVWLKNCLGPLVV